MEVQAVTKFTGISAQKARLVVDEVRGKQAEEALMLLKFMPQSAAKVVAKTIKSALANATENFGLEADDMYVLQDHGRRSAKPQMATIWRQGTIQALDSPFVSYNGHFGRTCR